MKRIVLGVMVAVAISVLALGRAAWSAAPAGTTINLLDVPESGVPVGDASRHENPHPGDQVLLTDALYRWDGIHRGSRVGHASATLTFRTGFSRTGAQVYIVGQLFLAQGSLLVEGFGALSTGRSTFTLPVVGGTGSYAGARGTMRNADIAANGEKSSIIVHLVQAAS